jgi:hypothetical protein
MKVNQTVPVAFPPRVITITLESKDEYDAFKELAGSNFTVANAVYKNAQHAREKLDTMLSQIYKTMCDSELFN